MSIDTVTGKAKELAGRGEEAAGEVFEDAKLRARGLARQMEGKVQGAMGSAADSIDDVADTVQSLVRRHPVGSLVAVGVAAYLLGRVAGAIRRRH
ncbi:CsbD family protein [Bordetella genomosp. 12]|uniref:CsbD family protein n=1 Tax=Bordetella genomosp. 12 TaxID=463035 RepID=A0A261VK41_9BORD|nr:CsbD family protein [Bordetella genomosp. 12]OZI74506.1 CsbD family protein [Bordetella genomosp. 12]